MIQFPRATHNLHMFWQDNQRYVADLDTGAVIAIDEVMQEILTLSSTCTFIQMLEQLKDRYPEESILKLLVDWNNLRR